MARLLRGGRQKMQRRPAPEIILTPLIDTVLVLLLVFMITTPLLHNNITVELPTSATNDQTAVDDTNDAITVSIDKARNLFIDEVPVSREKFFDELEKKIATSTKKGAQQGISERVVFVQADRSIPYGVVIQVVDDIKYIGGVKYVALSTEHAAG